MRRALFFASVAAATAIAIACGSSSDDTGAPAEGGATDSPTGGDGAPPQPPPPPSSSGDGGPSGNPCGADRRCKFDGETVESTTSTVAAVAVGKATVVVDDGKVAVRAGPGSWALSAAPMGLGSAPVRIVEDATGVQWIAFRDGGNSLSVAHGTATTTPNPDASMWTVESAIAQSSTFDAAIAIGSDGVPVVVSAGTQGILLARRTPAGTWTQAPVATYAVGARNVALAMNGTDPFVVWANPTTKEVTFAHASSPTTFATEVIATTDTFYDSFQIAIAVDASGNPHVVWKPDLSVSYATRAGGTWTMTPVPLISTGVIIPQSGPIRVAVAPSGLVALGVGGKVISVATNAGDGWFVQPVTSRCSDSQPGFDMTFDATSHLVIAHACASAVALMTQNGNYPPGYDATCNTVATTACNAACACPHGSIMGADICCMEKPGGSSDCVGASSIGACAQHYAVSVCGDATQDPSAPGTCGTALATPTCAPDAGTGVELPDACAGPAP